METKNGYIFYETFYKVLEELDKETKLKFYEALSEYGLFGKEPEFTGIEKALWIQMKFGIDNAKERYARNVENGKKGGRPKPTDNPTKPTDNPTKPTDNLNDNDNDNDNDNVKVKVNENAGETPENQTPSPSSFLAKPQENYSKLVFEKFKNAGLPCQNGDFFRFQSCDFRLAIQKLRNYHSDDVLGAIDNYIAELKKPDSFINQEYSFDNFIGTKTFSKCLPANYRPANFKVFQKDVPKARETDGERHFFEKCPQCGQKLAEWDNSAQRYVCRSCGGKATFEEVEGCRT